MIQKAGKTFILLIIIAVFCTACSHNTTASNPVENGFLDLSTLSRDAGPVRMDGQWRFISGRFVPPLSTDWATEARLVGVPDVWINYASAEQKISAAGICSMQISLKVKDPAERLGIKLQNIGTAYTLFADQRIIGSSGNPGTDRASEKPDYQPQIIYFTPGTGQFTLTFYISNFHDRFGGIWTPVLIGSEKKMAIRQYLDSGIDMAIIGVLFILAVYYLISWFASTGRKASLYFALGCLMLCLRSMTAGEIFFITVFPGFDFELNYKLQFASQAAASLFLFMSVRRMFPAVFHLVSERIVQILMLVYMVFILSTPLIVHSRALPLFFAFLYAVSAYFAVALFRALKRKLPGARILSAGMLIFICCIINDILYSTSLLHTGYFVPFGLILFSLSFVIVL
ncbi:MAG: 7TM-DISM domain-containing protein, partial [Spirochaetales bacterium]|nr:7TM-DISM domain-containing protein [Spirochaetales bacterium]